MMFGDLRRRYRHLRWKIRAKFPALSDGMLLAEVQGKRMYLDLRDRVVCETLYTRGIWELNVTHAFQRLLRGGMVVVDLGANVGYYTLLASEKVGQAGRVFAFEPDPFCYGLLAKNVAINRCVNVVTVNKAVSDRTGTAWLFLEAKNKGGHRLYASQETGHSIPVEVIRLDQYFPDGDSRVHLIKMDIQGAEMAALRGMRRIIEANEDLAIVVEFWPVGIERFGDDPADFVHALLGYGFRFHGIKTDGGGLERIDVSSLLARREGETHLLCEKGELFAGTARVFMKDSAQPARSQRAAPHRESAKGGSSAGPVRLHRMESGSSGQMINEVGPFRRVGSPEGLSVVIIARNEVPRVGPCLDSVAFADEVIVVDALSEDGTAELCRKRGARVFERPWTGYGDQKNFAMAQAAQPWVLILDADERVPDALREEIEGVLRGGGQAGVVAYRIPRRNYFYGKWLRHGGSFPDYQIRFLRRGAGRYNEVALHENLLVDGPIGTLRHPLEHLTEPTVADHFRRLDRYTTLAARETGERRARVGWTHLTVRPAVTLFKKYVLKQGFRDGVPGFLNCAFAAMHIFLKYAKVWEARLSQAAPGKP